MLRTEAKFLKYFYFPLLLPKTFLVQCLWLWYFPFHILSGFYFKSCLVCFCTESVSLMPLYTVYCYTLEKQTWNIVCKMSVRGKFASKLLFRKNMWLERSVKPVFFKALLFFQQIWFYNKICVDLGNPPQQTFSFRVLSSRPSQWYLWLPGIPKPTTFEALGFTRVAKEINLLGFLDSVISEKQLSGY